jgi:hypothetical protein
MDQTGVEMNVMDRMEETELEAMAEEDMHQVERLKIIKIYRQKFLKINLFF